MPHQHATSPVGPTCGAKMLTWHDVSWCGATSTLPLPRRNEALGEPISKLGKGWYNTHQYSLESIFRSRVLKHPCRVYNENESNLFYFPIYGGLDILRWHFKDASPDVKDTLALELVEWLKLQKPWALNSGKDHVFVLGKVFGEG
ncbi:hypothetical protein AgCh_023590 [Apium graveolens]